MSKRRHVFKVRFKVNGEPKSFKTTASSPGEAAKRLKAKNARVVSVTKVHA